LSDQRRRLIIPRETHWFCSQDWGFNAPGVILWWAAVGDGHWHIVREMKHQHESAETVAKKWKEKNRELGIKRVAYVVADPSMWNKTGAGKGPKGESIAETLLRHGMPMVKGDNDRKNGWQRCHELFRMAPDDLPWVTVDVSCRYGLRSVPAQVSEKSDPDDIDTGGDDHWVDAFRYGAMSRFVTSAMATSKPKPPEGSLGYYKQMHQQEPMGILARRSA
jgi:hypothetical protein